MSILEWWSLRIALFAYPLAVVTWLVTIFVVHWVLGQCTPQAIPQRHWRMVALGVEALCVLGVVYFLLLSLSVAPAERIPFELVRVWLRLIASLAAVGHFALVALVWRSLVRRR